MVSLKNSRRSRLAPATPPNVTEGSDPQSSDEYNPSQGNKNQRQAMGTGRRSLRKRKIQDTAGKGRENKFLAPSAKMDEKQTPHRIPAYLRSSHSCQKDSAESSDAQGKKSRGRNRAVAIITLPPGEKFPLLINKLGQPYGSHAKDLTRYVGVLARDPNKAPLIYHTWRELPVRYKDDVWLQIKNKFELPNSKDLPEAFRCYVMDSFKKKLSDWRCVLRNIYNIHDAQDARLQACPKDIPQDQWRSLMEYFDTKKSKDQSSRNANNRARQTMLHTLGTKSLACFRAEQSTEDSDGIDLPRLDVWIKTHTSDRFPKGTKGAAPIIDRLRNQASQLLMDMSEVSNPNNDVLSQELSKDYVGRARTYGLGAHVGDIDGSKPSKKSLMLQNEALKQKLSQLEEEALMLQNDELSQRIRRLEQFMEARGWRSNDA
ncbi:uncharacterized protein LOC116259068 [Nymphaea colorata]|nr:uncharacterized protein LOC116259068 [Nymphaea colorata]